MAKRCLFWIWKRILFGSHILDCLLQTWENLCFYRCKHINIFYKKEKLTTYNLYFQYCANPDYLYIFLRILLRFTVWRLEKNKSSLQLLRYTLIYKQIMRNTMCKHNVHVHTLRGMTRYGKLRCWIENIIYLIKS